MANLSTQEFNGLSKYIYSITGIYLDKNKEYLVQSRLNPLLVSFNLSSFSELYYKAQTDTSGELKKHIIDAISTNETFFFRDNTPFDLLKFKIVPELIDNKKKRHPRGKIPISIWSAACSTGQEVYSIAISLLEILPDIKDYEISILGSDISQQAITQASYGQYNKLEVGRGLPPEYLQKYFQPNNNGWRIKDLIRSMASFQVMNLMHPFGAIGPFDIVFCRNIAIYFSVPDRKKLFTRIANVLHPKGYLIVGGSEYLAGLAPQFEGQSYQGGMFYTIKDEREDKRFGTSKNRNRPPSNQSHADAPLNQETASRITPKVIPESRQFVSDKNTQPSSRSVKTATEYSAQVQQSAASKSEQISRLHSSRSFQEDKAGGQRQGLLSSLQNLTSRPIRLEGGNTGSDNSQSENSLLSRLQAEYRKKRLAK